MAEEAGVDLVEIAPMAQPPVCRIMDFGKFKYQEQKRQHEQKLKQKQVQVKEVKFRPGTDENDYQIKLRNMTRFLQEEDKVKVTLRFRGREMAHQEIGVQVVDRFIKEIAPWGHPDCPPKTMGKTINAMVSPLPKNKRAKHPTNDEHGNPLPKLERIVDVAAVVAPGAGAPASDSAAPTPGFSAAPAKSAKPASGFANTPFASLDVGGQTQGS